MFSRITKLTWMIRLFGFTKVAMIAYCRPSVIYFDDQEDLNYQSNISILILIFNSKSVIFKLNILFKT